MTTCTKCASTDTANETRHSDRTKRSAIILTDCFACGDTSTTTTPEGPTDMTARTITLWKDNRLDAEWEIPLEDLATRFAASPWADYEWPLERSIRAFITDRDGLSSVFLEEDFDAIDAACFDGVYANRNHEGSRRGRSGDTDKRRRPAHEILGSASRQRRSAPG